jgi:hypothetical protein
MQGVRMASGTGTLDIALTVEDDTLERVENFMHACFLQVQTVLIRYSLPTTGPGTSWECQSVCVYGPKFNAAGQKLSGPSGLAYEVPPRDRPEWLRSVVLENWPEPIGRTRV